MLYRQHIIGLLCFLSASSASAERFLPKRTFTEILAKGKTVSVADTTPELLKQHLSKIKQLEATGVIRLEFFFEHLESREARIADNAHLEFALSPDETFEKFCAQVDRAQARRLAAAHSPHRQRQRLYLAILAQCGDSSDADWLQTQLETNQAAKNIRDAYLATYLSLAGEAGMDFIAQKYLDHKQEDKRVSIAMTYNAMRAVRYISSHPEVEIPRLDLQQSLRLVLKNSLLVDLAINDLAYLKDWASTDNIVKIANESSDSTVHFAAINFLRRCPDNVANQQLEDFAERHPILYKRSLTFFPDMSSRAQRKSRSIRPTERGSSGGC